MATRYTPDRPMELQACLLFVGLSVTISTLGFWAKGWLPGLLLTLGLASIVYLLSRAVDRSREAWSAGHPVTAGLTGILAAGFAAIEANLNHIGLENLNRSYDLAPEAFLWPACWFLTLVNVFASYAFARPLEDRREPINPGKLLVQLREIKRKAA